MSGNRSAASQKHSLGKKKRRIRRPSTVTPERWVAWCTISRTFDDGAWTHLALPAEAERFELDSRQRAQAQHLAFGTVRLAGRLDYVIAAAGKRPPSKLDAPVLNALRLGAFGLLEADGAADHAVVDQTVEIVRAAVGERAVAFANAVMRRIQVDGRNQLNELDLAKVEDRAIFASTPRWMMDLAIADHGEVGALALEAQAGVPSPDSWWPLAPDDPRVAELGGAAVSDVFGDISSASDASMFTVLSPLARVGSDDPALLRELADEGIVVVQSLASQLASALVPVENAQCVLDMCAAPGGKTLALAKRMSQDAHLVAVELHPHRARELDERLQRARNNGLISCAITVIAADALQLDQEYFTARSLPTSYEAILLDAPCSGLGVLHRRPDSRWKREASVIAELSELQDQLLRRAATLLGDVDARLVYSVCTTTRREAEDVVDAVVADGLVHAVAEPIRTWPHVHATDGFFVSQLARGKR